VNRATHESCGLAGGPGDSRVARASRESEFLAGDPEQTHAYEPAVSKGIRMHKVLHCSLLKPFHTRSERQTIEVREGEGLEYLVNEIVGSARRNGKVR